jgi:1,4-alpha-glucan branching enzyme
MDLPPEEGLLPEEDLLLLAAGDHLRPWLWLGAHPQGVAGVRFAVWAQSAQRVSVVGSFNGWDGRRHPMRLRPQAGIWEVFVPGAAEGDFYKYELTDAQGALLPLKADPYAFRGELRPSNASIVSGLPEPGALPPGRAAANRREAPLSIYELHPMSWRRDGDGEGVPDWDLLARELPPYAAGLGFTHVELLPITEFPFDASWGYQTLGLHAPTARLGPPQGLRRFVQACHAAGLGVLLDFVPAHFPEDPHGLARFDGSALYEYADPREGWHQDWHTLIYDFGKPQVRQFLCGAALFWAERHGVDGLRVDAVASMLYRDYSRPLGEWLPNVHGGRENLEAIALLRHMNEVLGREVPGFITIAEESTAFPLVSAPTSSGGLGFHYKWNLGWMNDTLHYMRELPIHRQWHHDKITFGLVYAFHENFVLPLSHDEVVHAKGALIQKMPADDRPVEDIPPRVMEAWRAATGQGSNPQCGGQCDGQCDGQGGAGDPLTAPGDWQRFAGLRAYYGFMWGHPGKKLLFMGQEFAQPHEWDFESALPWALLKQPAHAGVHRLVGALNQLYRRWPALHRQEAEPTGFEWLQDQDREQSVFAFARHVPDQATVVVVSNFTPVPREGYRLRLPTGAAQEGDWCLLLDTDSADFAGTGWLAAGPAPKVGAGGLVLDLPPMATLFLVDRSGPPGLPDVAISGVTGSGTPAPGMRPPTAHAASVPASPAAFPPA